MALYKDNFRPSEIVMTPEGRCVFVEYTSEHTCTVSNFLEEKEYQIANVWKCTYDQMRDYVDHTFSKEDKYNFGMNSSTLSVTERPTETELRWIEIHAMITKAFLNFTCIDVNDILSSEYYSNQLLEHMTAVKTYCREMFLAKA